MRIAVFAVFFMLMGCQTEKNPLARALASDAEEIKRVMENAEAHEIQVLFTEVHRDKEDKVHFEEYSFQVDDSLYFYPASTVKLPVAILALEKLHEENKFTRHTRFYVEGDTLETTFAREIEKIFAVSDNEAYNRLLEYLGQDEINKRLNNRGIEARISHRLSVDDADNVTPKPLIFYLNDSTTTPVSAPVSKPATALPLKKMLKGKGYLEEETLIDEPKDFSRKNYLPLKSLHGMMKRLFFPEMFPEKERFRLSEGDREFLIRTMTILPREAGYVSEEYYDSYVKYFLFGDSREPVPEDIIIYSKAGAAYGYLTDCAYIVDKEKNKEYILTATVYVNANGIFNDDTYEYDTIGIPFLAELGRQLIVK